MSAVSTPIKQARTVRALTVSYVVSRAIHVAAELDLAGLLATGRKTHLQLAKETSAHAPSLQRLLRALVSFGLFSEDPAGCYANNETSELLRSDVTNSMRAWARLMGADFQWRSAQALLHSVRTGEPAFAHVFGEQLFEYFRHAPVQAKLFDEAMVNSSELVNEAIVDSYDFAETTTVVDVAGGHGSTLCGILRKHPRLRGILMDLPHVIDEARAFVAKQGLLDRCTFVRGSFFERIPTGADAYFMKHILHDWDDERCRSLLRNCHAAMPDHAKLLICEKVLPEDNTNQTIRIFDLIMLIDTTGGRERTEQEYGALLEESGFLLERSILTPTDNSILVAVKRELELSECRDE